jgi:hypothetical protein
MFEQVRGDQALKKAFVAFMKDHRNAQMEID